ncbi:hypothetical protein AWB76_07019 [Caballeronia temeraria]|uniref:Uncharacterized protein n=1 Tax=Caballeronia temeraria TaxID=1777137 RepID=A0A158DIN3_9BURK|nr:hypothetical protein AWB76_07019 [Caballeronia temeraria]
MDYLKTRLSDASAAAFDRTYAACRHAFEVSVRTLVMSTRRYIRLLLLPAAAIKGFSYEGSLVDPCRSREGALPYAYRLSRIRL